MTDRDIEHKKLRADLEDRFDRYLNEQRIGRQRFLFFLTGLSLTVLSAATQANWLADSYPWAIAFWGLGQSTLVIAAVMCLWRLRHQFHDQYFLDLQYRGAKNESIAVGVRAAEANYTKLPGRITQIICAIMVGVTLLGVSNVISQFDKPCRISKDRTSQK